MADFSMKIPGLQNLKARASNVSPSIIATPGFHASRLTPPVEPESAQGAFVSAEFFPTLGISPLLGRTFNS